jgi:hypothetical protein
LLGASTSSTATAIPNKAIVALVTSMATDMVAFSVGID